MRLITNTYCECTRVARYKSEVKDSYPEKKSQKVASKTLQKKMSETENTILWLALKKILCWQKELDERTSFVNTAEGKMNQSKWKAFNDHMCTLIETNTV